jgi:hypothetical protein
VGFESAKADWVVVVILVGMGKGDSRMETAAVEGMVGEAEEEPRTMTCRFVDLRAESRLDGGAACQLGVPRGELAYSCPLSSLVSFRDQCRSGRYLEVR